MIDGGRQGHVLENLALVFLVLWTPRWAMAHVIERRPLFVAWMVWLGSWVMPMLVLMSGEDMFFAIIMLIVFAVPAVIMLAILSAALSGYLREEEFDGGHVTAVLGYSAVPHLLLATAMTWLWLDTLGAPHLTGLPAGVGIAAAAVVGFWNVSGEIRVPSLMSYFPPFLTIWSSLLVVVGMRHMSNVGWPKIALGFVAAVTLSAIMWAVFGFVLGVFIFTLSLGF